MIFFPFPALLQQNPRTNYIKKINKIIVRNLGDIPMGMAEAADGNWKDQIPNRTETKLNY